MMQLPQERPVVFNCKGERLFGLLHAAERSTGFVLIVGGPQYRAGSHRLFVTFARALAARGFPLLRFDARGMGDSTGTPGSFEDITPDISAAIDALMAQQPQVQQVVLWGLCDGASAALLYLQDRGDSRVSGLCLLNPWVRSEASLARTHVKHYYLQRLLQREFWTKLLAGRINRRALQDLWQTWMQSRAGDNITSDPASKLNTADARTSFQTRMARAWSAFPGKIVLILSDNDFTAKEYVEYTSDSPIWIAAFARNQAQRLTAIDSDHTFSAPESLSGLVEAAAALGESLTPQTSRRQKQALAEST